MEKTEILVGLGIGALVIATMVFFLASPSLVNEDFVLVGIVFILVIFSIYIIWDRMKSVGKGFPAKDERLRLVGYKAGYYGFMAAIWSAVGSNLGHIMLFDQELRGGLVVASVVLVSGFVFVLSYIYMLKKGIKD